jgi:S-formylglutathione hydrolase FrmB
MVNATKAVPAIIIVLVVISFCSDVRAADDRAIAENVGFIADKPLKVQEVIFHSEAVNRDMRFNIVLPKDYITSGKHYPVLYMLHGLTANYLEWTKLGVPQYANRHDLIVVMVDGGNSWYVNWAKSYDDQKNNWDDYITKDLIGYVDSHYRTIAKRQGRAISGLSMGGYGALAVGLRHPDMFCSIASHSGALSLPEVRSLLSCGPRHWSTAQKVSALIFRDSVRKKSAHPEARYSLPKKILKRRTRLSWY